MPSVWGCHEDRGIGWGVMAVGTEPWGPMTRSVHVEGGNVLVVSEEHGGGQCRVCGGGGSTADLARRVVAEGGRAGPTAMVRTLGFML